MPTGLYLKQVEVGPMQNFVYLIGDRSSRECVVVDPAWEIDGIADLVAADDMQLTGVLVTHTHQDHVGGHLFGHDIPGIPELLAKHPAKVYVHRAEREFLKGFGSDLVKVEAGDTLQVGAIPLTFVHTPGHTPGSLSMLVRQPGATPLLMVGDLTYDAYLMQDGNLPGLGETAQVRQSTRAVNTLRGRYPDLAVLPAHDPAAGTRLSASSWGRKPLTATAG